MELFPVNMYDLYLDTPVVIVVWKKKNLTNAFIDKIVIIKYSIL